MYSSHTSDALILCLFNANEFRGQQAFRLSWQYAKLKRPSHILNLAIQSIFSCKTTSVIIAIATLTIDFWFHYIEGWEKYHGLVYFRLTVIDILKILLVALSSNIQQRCKTCFHSEQPSDSGILVFSIFSQACRIPGKTVWSSGKYCSQRCPTSLTAENAEYIIKLFIWQTLIERLRTMSRTYGQQIGVTYSSNHVKQFTAFSCKLDIDQFDAL